ncbi:MAG TPA: hypothetical protein VKB53_12880 [Gammaproteobacteria bacterium]|nr:hypothetical protein [Gammaproteobacteria bacterium]HKH21748.1 hypothetical protein [Gammaproteobacteria bacterium]
MSGESKEAAINRHLQGGGITLDDVGHVWLMDDDFCESILPWTRDKHLGCIRRIGRAPYKQVTGYHRRSLAETAMFRVKTLFGNQARSRGSAGRAAELLIRCNALNRIAHLGLPDSYAV